MEIKKLQGGRVIGTNAERLPVSLYADDPKARVGAPGTIYGNVGQYAQLNYCSKRQHGTPEPTLAKIVFREIGGEVFLVMAPARQEGQDVYPLKFEGNTKALTVRGLKLLFAEAKIALRSELWYEMETEIAEDEDLGFVVIGNWTAAVTRLRPEGEAEAAAAAQQ